MATVAILAALALQPVAAAPEKTDSASLITDARGLTFSGYDRAESGRRRWTLTAATATPADAGGKRWSIANLRIRTFDAAGKAGIEVNAPAATFLQQERAASDPGPLSLTGEQIVLSGKNWSWNVLENHDNRIEIREAVRVTLAPRATTGAKRRPIHIDADRLIALTGAKGGMTLTFSGKVRVRSDDVVLSADTLTTVVRSAGDGSGGPITSGADRAAVDTIRADGAVRVARRGAIVSGDHADFTPATGVYAVTGNARFTDLSDRRVLVTGDAMRYDSVSRLVTVTLDAEGRVRAELPALDRRRDPEAVEDDRATVSAGRIAIRIAGESHRLELEDDVRVDDPQNSLRCGRLTVETPRRETEFAATGAPAGGVSRIVAENAVQFARDGRVLRCERAEILPPQNKAVLTGRPVGEDPAHHASLEAATMTLDTATRTLVAESEPGRRVRVTLADRRAGGTAAPYTVDADLMEASQHAGGALFEFEDHVTLAGKDLTGACERLAVEVDGKAGAAAGRVRRIVAAGGVKLTQAAYTAEAARAEILPGAALRELSPAEDNGLDGKSPVFVTLESDLPAGVRTRVTLPAPAIPKLTATGPLVVTDAPADAGGDLSIAADFQELVAGRDRLRAFSRGGVVVTSPDLHGRCDALEIRAVSPPAETAERAPSGKPRFAAEALIARGHVTMKLGERDAAADTIEVLPPERRIALIGQPSVTGWPTPAGVARKTVDWKPGRDAEGRSTTRIRLADEAAAGMPEQIIRPRLTLPPEMSPDLGRSLRKSLDKKAP